MIDRRAMIAGALAAAATGRAQAEPAVSRVTAYAFSFPALSEGEIRLAGYSGPARCSSSTPPRSAATPRNTPGYNNCGPSFATADSA